MSDAVEGTAMDVGAARPRRASPFTVVVHYSVLIMLAGAWIIWQTSLLRDGPGYAAVGPKTFPYVIGAGVLLSGLALLIERFLELRRPSGDGSAVDESRAQDESAHQADWQTLVLVGALLALYVGLYQPLGFVLSSALFLVGCCRTLGSRALLRDIVVAVALALVTYVAFTRLLSLELPGGPIDEPLRALANVGKPPIVDE